jgi:hypothetical protein
MVAQLARMIAYGAQGVRWLSIYPITSSTW